MVIFCIAVSLQVDIDVPVKFAASFFRVELFFRQNSYVVPQHRRTQS
jgi:hypothetical protein